MLMRRWCAWVCADMALTYVKLFSERSVYCSYFCSVRKRTYSIKRASLVDHRFRASFQTSSPMACRPHRNSQITLVCIAQNRMLVCLHMRSETEQCVNEMNEMKLLAMCTIVLFSMFMMCVCRILIKITYLLTMSLVLHFNRGPYIGLCFNTENGHRLQRTPSSPLVSPIHESQNIQGGPKKWTIFEST